LLGSVAVDIRFEVTPNEGVHQELAGRAQFINTGEATIAFLPIHVESPSLALEIEDGRGDPVLLPPPPVPDPSAQPFELAPGASYEATYLGFLPPWTQPGPYRVRARLVGVIGRGGVAESDWSEITVLA
jgi:hypothetical protein